MPLGYAPLPKIVGTGPSVTVILVPAHAWWNQTGLSPVNIPTRIVDLIGTQGIPGLATDEPYLGSNATLAQTFDGLAESWDVEHGAASPRAPEFWARIVYLRLLCQTVDRGRILDVGCGTGQHLLHLADAASGFGFFRGPEKPCLLEA